MNATVLLSELCKRVSDMYLADASSPSVTVSWLVEYETWYVSVCRYSQRLGQGKYVVDSCRGDDLEACLAYLLYHSEALGGDPIQRRGVPE